MAAVKGVNLKVKDNSGEVLNALNGKILVALEAIGLQCEGYAKKECPVDTGRLRNSITHEARPSEKAVYIGTNVEYATRVEYDDKAYHKVGKAHYLRDAATNHTDEYKKLAEFYLQK